MENMLVAQKTDSLASINKIKARAKVFSMIRQFFETRHILEVDTPLLYHSTVTDPHLEGIEVPLFGWLQTSPEYAMKRLLAAGSGDIYQLGKAFRKDESGPLHHYEFTLLEWYRLGYDHFQLMDEVYDFLTIFFPTMPHTRISYQEVFEKFCNINPLKTTPAELQEVLSKNKISFVGELTKNLALDLLFSTCIEPQLKDIMFIYHYPADFAALAKLNPNDPNTAERFEVFVNGIELANGYHELQDHDAQLLRFKKDNQQRKMLGRPKKPLDDIFLKALKTQGLPPCAGVALGVDRLMKIYYGAGNIREGMLCL
jgi:lysyl-tRNA synthetase class 2